MKSKLTANEFWKQKWDEYPQNAAEKLAVAMMNQYFEYASQQPQQEGVRTEYGICPVCNGKGYIFSSGVSSSSTETCYHCNGTKSVVSAIQIIPTTIPAGYKEDEMEKRCVEFAEWIQSEKITDLGDGIWLHNNAPKLPSELYNLFIQSLK